MSDGLPDKAVEAMARALDPEGAAPLGARARARDALAALPAGVYVSDGEGNVTPGDDVAAVLRQILTVVSLPITQRRGVSDARLDAIRNATERALAALSATDTDKADG